MQVSGRYKGLDSERPSDLGEAAAFQGEVPTSPMAFKKIAAAKAVAEAEEAATKQAAATAKARYTCTYHIDRNIDRWISYEQ